MIDQDLQSALRKRYNPEGSALRRLQLQQLEILKAFDGICRRNGLRYIMEGGTLLGAVRHGGFIPWDDDVDISMPLQDFRRFQQIASSELPVGMVLQNHKTDPNYFVPILKIRDATSESHSQTDGLDKYYKYKGPFIDIFPIEPTIAPISYVLLKANNFLLNHLRRRWLKHGCWHLISAGIEVARLLTPRSAPLNPGYAIAWHYNLKSDDVLFPVSEIEFENHKFFAPNDIDAFLKNYFGPDYMSLPPEKGRLTHYEF